MLKINVELEIPAGEFCTSCQFAGRYCPSWSSSNDMTCFLYGRRTLKWDEGKREHIKCDKCKKIISVMKK